ncbi:propionyl-CoA carboxylase alpha chain, mitochondrial-like [Halichondria panicea]|uniref:propionyl-CoA carboxylase alpha chain, mitochondrial-like n=1 Tax=Halichondria panicea TaxID=6063 RepID=UPI00312B4885
MSAIVRTVLRRRGCYRRPISAGLLSRRGYATKDRKTFDKILIANRGEIACRVMKTCKEMGIKSVAIYSDADAQALHVRMADEAVRVGPATATESYLNMPAILEAVETTGAQAVHPGYGFFSENSVFFDELEHRGVTFIGPATHALSVMGDKLESKRTAMEAQVNTVPGFDGIVKDADEAIKLANEIGYPVMLKASAGGGGKGMRISWNDEETRQGFHLATEEAKSAVKDDRLLIEKFVDKSRHIEIQVLGDKHGNAIHLNERECSIQRRNQKVVEEAPSTFIDPGTRSAMGAQAVALAKAVDYSSAGTVEFLVDSSKNFYFLEMNTRLQVEHPITELTTGVDIVEQMIYSAAGHPLSLTQDDIGVNGWAIEARVYAEDPVRFLPSIGYLSTYIEPTERPGLENVRVDTGIVEGSTISMYYDPMISKLCTYGETRDEALATMAKALDNYCIRGVNHNIPILRDIITQPSFIKGDITTNFINDVYPDGFQGRTLNSEETDELIAAAAFMHVRREELARQFLNQDRQSEDIDITPESWDLVVTLNKERYPVTTSWEMDGGFTVEMDNGRRMELSTDWSVGEPMMLANINGKDVTVQYESRRGRRLYLRHYGDKHSVVVQSTRSAELAGHVLDKSAESQLNILRAPMPGVVKSILCVAGESVAEGANIVTLEAMKMQNPLFAPMSGIVKEVFVREGDSIGEDEVILEFYPQEQESKAQQKQ